MNGRVVVSIHDVAPSTFERSMALLGLVERQGIAATLLVVPGPWNGARPTDDPRFVRWLTAREADGHEVCLHGWSHAEPVDARSSARSRLARLIARGCAEFADLSEEEARPRIVDGLSTLRAIGCHPVGFTPPGWLASEGALSALKSAGFMYTTSQFGVTDLMTGQVHRIPAVCQRPDSPLTAISSHLIRRILVSRVAESRDVRLALHPADLGTEALRHETTTLVQVASFGRTTTYRELVQERRTASGATTRSKVAA